MKAGDRIQVRVEDESYTPIVWVVERGEDNEGGSIRGIYSDEGKAVRAALGMQAAFGGDWYEDEPNEYSRSAHSWHSHCDWIQVRSWDVQ